MTAFDMPWLGTCVCDGPVGVAMPHEHSDFEPHACTALGCPCPAFRSVYAETEPAENQAQTAADPRNRASVTIPADALDFAHERTAQTAAWIDDVLSWAGADTTNADDPMRVCGFADALESIKPEDIDVYDALALALRRIAAGQRDNSARRFVAGIRRKVAGR